MEGTTGQLVPGCLVEALFDYTATEAAELSFHKGDRFLFIESDPRGWAKGEFNGRRGWFAITFVERVSDAPDAGIAPPLTSSAPLSNENKSNAKSLRRSSATKYITELQNLTSSGNNALSSNSESAIISPRESQHSTAPSSSTSAVPKPPPPRKRIQNVNTPIILPMSQPGAVAGTGPANPPAPPKKNAFANTLPSNNALKQKTVFPPPEEKPDLPYRPPAANSRNLPPPTNVPAKSHKRQKSEPGNIQEPITTVSTVEATKQTSASQQTPPVPPRIKGGSNIHNFPPPVIGNAPRPYAYTVCSSSPPQIDELEEEEPENNNNEDDDEEFSILNSRSRTEALLNKWLPTRVQLETPNEPNLTLLLQRKKKSKIGKFKGKKIKGVYGVDLKELQMEGREIPIVVMQCVSYLQKNGLETEGIFRVPGNRDQVEKIKKMYKSPSEFVDQSQFKNTHVVATLLKQFFQMLPEPCFPFDFYEAMMNSYDQSQANQERILLYRGLVSRMPTTNVAIARFLFKFLYRVAQMSHINKMQATNLGLVFGPTLLRPRQQDSVHLMQNESAKVIEFLIENYDKVFGEDATVTDTPQL